MWQATRQAAELIKLVTYCNNMNAYCANLSCTHLHAHTQKINKNKYIKKQNSTGIRPVNISHCTSYTQSLFLGRSSSGLTWIGISKYRLVK